MNFLKDYRRQIANEVNGHIHDWIKHVPQPTMIGGEPLLFGGGAKSNFSKPLGYTSPHGPSTLATGDSWRTRQLRGGEMEEIMSESDDEEIGGGFWKDFGHGFEKGFTDAAKVVSAPAIALGTTMETGDPMKGAEAFSTVNKVLKGKGISINPTVNKVKALIKKDKMQKILNEYEDKLEGQLKKNQEKAIEKMIKKEELKSKKSQEKETKKRLTKAEKMEMKERKQAEKLEKEERKKAEKLEKLEKKESKKGKKAMKDAETQYEEPIMEEGGVMVGRDKASRKPIPVSNMSYIKQLKGGGKTHKRAEIVKKVMREKGLKMIEASKYVKEHGLY